MYRIASLIICILSYYNGAGIYCLGFSVSKVSPKRNSLALNNKTSIQASLISPSDAWGLWSAVSTSAALGLQLEKRTSMGKSLSGPVCAMLISALLTNFNVLPPEGSIYISQLQSFVVKLATPLLLLGADLRVIYKESGSLLRAFFLGTLGTLLGSFIGFLLMRPFFLHYGVIDDTWRLAGALTAKNIGGGLNFMAVVDALKVTPAFVSVGLAVDNILGLLYFPFISWLGVRYNIAVDNKSVDSSIVSTPETMSLSSQVAEDDDDMNGWITSLSLGAIIVTCSDKLATIFGIPAVVISTLMAVSLATIAGKALPHSVVHAGSILGRLLLLLFFGSIGNSSGNILQVLQSPLVLPVFGYGLILYAVHLSVILGLGHVFNWKQDDLLLASNANIGNAATASALAASMKWQSKLVPAMIVGTMGNVMGTFAGYALALCVLKPLGGIS